MARRDRKFFQAILKNPRKALEAKGKRLSPSDMKKLERALKKVYRMNGKDLARVLVLGQIPWPIRRPWPAVTSRPWPM